MKSKIIFFFFWLTMFSVVTFLCGLAYLIGQQILRQGANDPQIQLAQDTALSLNSGQMAEKIIPQTKIDLEQSLAPFIIVYDSHGQVIFSQALLNNKTPNLPPSSLDYVQKNGESRITWQPRKEVRIASVIEKYNGGYVLAGRSLKEVEKREDWLLINTILVYFVTISALSFFTLIFVKVAR